MTAKLILPSAVALVLLTGCLQTRDDLKENEEKKVLQTQVTSLQRNTADQTEHYQEVETDVRSINGRVEAVENQQNVDRKQNLAAQQETQKKINDLSTRVSLLTDTVTKLDQELQQNNLALQALQQVKAAPPEAPTSSKGGLAAANDEFNNKNWKKAILAYEKYRSQNPGGKHYAEATYKIGVCFQELNSRDAQSFFQEVISKFPQSPEAKKAAFRLKQIK